MDILDGVALGCFALTGFAAEQGAVGTGLVFAAVGVVLLIISNIRR